MNRRTFIIGSLSVATLTITETAKANHHNNKSLIHKSQHTKKNNPKIKYHNKVKLNLSKHDRNILVETIWGETRGETLLGKMAVVHVILNRHLSNDPIFKNHKTLSQLCLKKFQFSCWLDKVLMRHIKKDETFEEVKEAVNKAIDQYQKGIDYSNGALYYYADYIKEPKWAKKMNKVNSIGHHKFYA